MEEYARRRFRFVCPSAVKLPSVMVTAETTPTTAGHGIPASASAKPVDGAVGPANADPKKRSASAKPAAFGPTERNAVNGVGAPSYTSGHHMCHGTAAILYPTPAVTNTTATTRAMRVAASDAPAAPPIAPMRAPMSSRLVVPVRPYR